MPAAKNAVNNLTSLVSSARALMNMPNLTASDLRSVTSIKQELAKTSSACSSFKEADLKLKEALVGISAPYMESVQEIRASFGLSVEAATDCASNAKMAAERVAHMNSSSEHNAVYSQFMGRLEGALELLETKDAAIIDQLLQDFGDLDVAALLGEAVDSVASINLEQVADHLAQCVVARESYMKAYAEVTLLGTPLARLSMHERDGISFAHYDLVDGKKIVASHK